MGIGGPKEGFSVFGLLSGACSTPMGRRMLRLWFLRPIVNLEVLHGSAPAPCHAPLSLLGPDMCWLLLCLAALQACRSPLVGVFAPARVA